MPLHPISFAIAEEYVKTEVPHKTKLMGTVIPFNNSTYIFKTQDDYFNDYATSLFGKTCKKAGWDCMRHYEILANGCIPYFHDLPDCPPNTMHDFPRELVLNAMKLHDTHPELDINDEQYQLCIQQLLEYTRNNLTTVKQAQRILDICGKNQDAKVLFINKLHDTDYLRCTIIHGMKKILKSNCVDAPRLPHLYKSFPEDQALKLYGNGFTYTRLLDEDCDQCDRSNIEEKIKSHYFDLIVYGTIHRSQDYWHLVHAHYDKKDIVIMCGEDLHNCPFKNLTFSDKYHVFLREQ